MAHYADVMNKIYQRNQNIVLRKIGTETLLIPISQAGVELQKVFVLNESAEAIWRYLENPLTVDHLLSTLGEEFAGDPREMEKDVREILDDLLKLDMVEEV